MITTILLWWVKWAIWLSGLWYIIMYIILYNMYINHNYLKYFEIMFCLPWKERRQSCILLIRVGRNFYPLVVMCSDKNGPGWRSESSVAFPETFRQVISVWFAIFSGFQMGAIKTGPRILHMISMLVVPKFIESIRFIGAAKSNMWCGHEDYKYFTIPSNSTCSRSSNKKMKKHSSSM